MATRTSASLKHAFKRFVELVRPIEDVRHVVAFDDELPEIFTYITKLDEKVMFQVYDAQVSIMEDYPELPLDFHIRYLEGRPLESFVYPMPPLSFSKVDAG
jgi:hypothetical protein